MTNFLPHTEADRQAMLKAIGLTSVSELFSDIPDSLKDNVTFSELPAKGLSEAELQAEMTRLAANNKGADFPCFLGGGAYHRFIPMAVNTIAGRSEFYTAYTPYQPEIAQGTLQYTYEFQTMICELTGMDVANASVYDGGVAVAEAALMALRANKKKNTILVAHSVHPDYREVLETYLKNLEETTLTEFVISEGLPETVNADDVAGVIVQVPSYFGTLEDLEAIKRFTAENDALFIVSADPVSLALLPAPGTYGADIVVGDIQPLGNNLAFGGPYGGYMACRHAYMRQLPGRLVGRTLDKNGTPCYTLTLQTREQHIRRDRATSNICTNQALNILKATVYLAVMGPEGLRQVADISARRAHYLVERLKEIKGVSLRFNDTPYLYEFTLDLPCAAKPVLRDLEAEGILGGIALTRVYPDMENALLVTCTELTTPADIERYVTVFRRIIETRATSGGQTEKKSPSRQKREACQL